MNVHHFMYKCISSVCGKWLSNSRNVHLIADKKFLSVSREADNLNMASLGEKPVTLGSTGGKRRREGAPRGVVEMQNFLGSSDLHYA